MELGLTAAILGYPLMMMSSKTIVLHEACVLAKQELSILKASVMLCATQLDNHNRRFQFVRID